MISSEVQRTLVKSPPELWAELSDPKSLSRHLGELGEIRITRSEPEELLEWEAEEARGSVAIKASGWGTKVTLKASRQYTPAETPETEAAPAEPAEMQATEPQDMERPVVSEPDVAPEPDLAAEPGPASGPEPAAEYEMPAEPMPSGLDAWTRQEAEIAVTAAERFEHEHSASLLGSDLQLAADRELEVSAPAADQPEAPEPEPETPRMGFFARLFGRSRRSTASVKTVAFDPVAIEDPAPELEVTPPEVAPPEEPTLETEIEAPALDQAPAEPEPEAELEPATGPEADASLTVEHPELSAVAEPGNESEESPEHHDETPAVDLAAELKAAEEAAEEEVTAILTGVLDRLGAAHHRPFSRA